MNKIFNLLVAAALCAGLDAESMAQSQADGGAAQRMGRYNVVWTSPSKDASGVMPIGNGDIAAGVYAIENGDLYLLLSKNDAFNYCGDLYKTGRVRVSLNPNPFTAGKPFRQTLDLPTGSIQIEADGVKFRIWADANRPLYHVEIDSPRDLALSAQPEFWPRYDQWKHLDPTPDERVARGNKVLWYFSVGDKSFYPEEIKKIYGIENPEKIAPDPYRFNTFGNLLEIPGDPNLRAKHGVIAFVKERKGRKFDIRIHSLTMQTPNPDAWVQAIENLASWPVDLKQDWEKHSQWWKSFWDRSWIIASDRTVPADQREKLNSEANDKGLRDEPDGAALVSQSYNFFRFAMAAQSRGRLQPKFNGGLFTQQYRLTPSNSYVKENDLAGMKSNYPGAEQQGDEWKWMSGVDYRPWGRRFTFQNQRLLYWPLLMSGDFDLMKPFFDHYWNVLPMRKAITQKYFEHAGAFYRENLMPLTGSDYDCGMPPKTKPGENVKGDYHSYYFTSGLETVAMMSDYAYYTGDAKFRDEVLVPFAREIFLFFDKHYQRGPDGKLRLDPSQAIETWWVTVNPAPDVAGLRFCLDQLLAMKAGTPEDQAAWKKFRAEIPEVPMQTIQGRQALAPAEKYEHQGNGENAELYPVFPFRCYGLALGSKDLVQWTMQNRTCKDTFGGTCWTQDQIDWAYAGNAEEAAKGLVRRFRIASPSVRFPIYAREGADSVPDWDHFGSGSIALQRMLVQEGQGKINLLPAWPAEWDVDFKLHLQGGTVLTGTVKDGKLVAWDITPTARKADVVVCGPAKSQTAATPGSK
ncbi:MAG: DUF5703 domain-containing protein [Verrucomicrobiota bacterium]